MKKIVKENLALERFTLPRDEAIKFMQEKEEPYKVESVSYTHLGNTVWCTVWQAAETSAAWENIA